ncbi:metal ABC transporter ATP-binding protein [Aureimonas sp. AU4]|uniref:metal ABC transporter ATP-binding protein n=1 Tax=Aureimonas sp. AU4 TaxID=1638163 RepID=UPI0007804CCF|nr:ABC transporter ATP-binding protein [Aureimonas sp. AU4]
MTSSIGLEGVCVRFGRTVALEPMDATFAPGSMTAVIGENGAGKSTLLRAIMGLVRLTSGRVRLDGVRRRDIAYLPQAQEIDRSFPIDVTDFVSFGAWPRIGLTRSLSATEQQKLLAAIERVGLFAERQKAIAQLSGGQFQRALFARLILQDAPILLLDEPFAAVDAKTTADLTGLLRGWHADGRTIVAVLHDIGLVEREFERTMLLKHGLVAHGPSRVVLASAIAERQARARLVAA